MQLTTQCRAKKMKIKFDYSVKPDFQEKAPPIQMCV